MSLNFRQIDFLYFHDLYRRGCRHRRNRGHLIQRIAPPRLRISRSGILNFLYSHAVCAIQKKSVLPQVAGVLFAQLRP